MATTTTNYSLLKPAGTDAYNHLIYDNPNMDTIDLVMKANADAAITSATCVKTGTTHTVVRTNTDAPVFRFTATGDWNTGDTMTVDGVTVTPYLPNGEALVDGAYVINSEVIAVVNGSRVTVYSNGINQISASHVKYDNTSSGLVATNTQDAIDELTIKLTHTPTLLDVKDIPTTATQYACDWNNYRYLIVSMMQYGNVVANYCISHAYFNTTNAGRRAIISTPTRQYEIYKDDTSHVYIKSGQQESNYGIMIEGMI